MSTLLSTFGFGPPTEGEATRFDPSAMMAIKVIGLIVAFALVVVTVATNNRAVAVLVSLAVGGTGVVLGFLFGIPRSAGGEGTADASAGNSGSGVAARASSRPRNASLEQVADWLTKLLLGAGLTQLGPVWNGISALATYIASCVAIPEGGSANLPYVFGLGVIGFFGSNGFLGGYLATRLLLARLLTAEELQIDSLERAAAERGRAQGKAEGKVEGKAEGRDEIVNDMNAARIQEQTAGFRGTGAGDAASDQLLADAQQWNPPKPATVANDPQKNRFGGRSSRNNRTLTAEVAGVSGPESEVFTIKLKAAATDGAPLSQPVKFFLHDSFAPDSAVVLPRAGIVELELVSWGAFTVGAITDGGQTMLELDLAELPDAPKKFRER